MDGNLNLPTVLQEPLRLTARPGLTLQTIVDAALLPDEAIGRTILILNGRVVKDWAHVMTLDGDVLEMLVVPSGGGDQSKQIFAAIATIAISLAAPYAAGFVLGEAVAAGAAHSVAFYALTAGITLLGTMAVSALITPSQPFTTGTSMANAPAEAQAYRITGQNNQGRPYGTVPRVYGRIRFYPPLAATPLIENVGTDSHLTGLYDFGIGSVEISDVRIGNLEIDVAAPEMVLWKSTDGKALKLVNKSPAYDEFTIQLEKDDPITLDTHAEAKSATLDIFFPQGLTALSANGTRSTHAVPFRIEYRLQGGPDPTWIQVPATSFKGVKTNPQSWIYTSEYDQVDDEGTFWAVDTWQSGEDSMSQFRLYQNGPSIGGWTGTNSSVADVEQYTANGRPYRRGALQGVTSDWGGVVGRTRTYYGLQIPKAPPANSVQVTGSTMVPFTASVQITFTEAGVHEIRTTRLSAPAIGEDAEQSLRDVCDLVMLKSFRTGPVVNLALKHALLELAFTANAQLSTSVDTVNGVAFGWIKTITPTGRSSADSLTSNPAAIALDILMGIASSKKLQASQIDWPSWYALYQECNEMITTVANGKTYQTPRYEWNGVIDSNMTVQQAVDAVLSVARAARCFMPNGKVGVMMDVARQGYRQMITPANSWDFEGNRVFTPPPDGFRVAFLDRDADWAPKAIVAYADGKNESNAVLIEDLTTWGITSFPQAWRHGRYMLAQGLLRSETFSVSMDVENLAFSRGDLVAIQHDVPLLGGMAMRVTSVENNVVMLARPLEIGSGHYTVRLSNGTIRSGAILSQIDATTYNFDNASGIQPDDLIAVGNSAPVTRPYIVQGIEPGDDLTARINLVAYVEGVYTADEGDIPDWNPGFGDGVDGSTDAAVTIRELSYKWTVINGVPYAEIYVRWAPTGAIYAYAGSDVYLRQGNVTLPIGSARHAGTGAVTYGIIWSDASLISVPLTIFVTPQSITGKFGTPAEAQITIAPYAAVPAPPTGLALQTRGTTIDVSWWPSQSQDVVAYVLRYTPDLVNPTWATSQFIARVDAPNTSTAMPAMVGTLMVRSVNVIGNMSDIVSAVLPIDQMFNFKQIMDIDDAPTWLGVLDGFQKGYSTGGISGARVMLLNSVVIVATMTGVTSFLVKKLDGSFVDVANLNGIPTSYLVSTVPWTSNLAERAYYYVVGTVDLGDIFETVLQSRILAGVVNLNGSAAFNAVAKNITPLADLPTTFADTDAFDAGWSAWLEYRCGDTPGVWLPWRRLAAGIMTGRYFEFRIAANASTPDTLVVIYDGDIQLGMGARTFFTGLLAYPVGGLDIDFEPPFFEPPVLSVTTDASGGGASFEVSGYSRTGTHLTLVGHNGNPTAGNAVLSAVGYGTERAAAT